MINGTGTVILLTFTILFLGADIWFRTLNSPHAAPKFSEKYRHKEKEHSFKEKVRFVAGIQPDVFVTKENATSIFGAVHNALRQKGSDLNPVGLSIFPAVIPAGTFLYHATWSYYPSSPEWIAMDAEFSYNFGNRGDEEHTLLTFRAVKDLNKVIVLDGASASKQKTGEMDTQILLAGGSKEDYTNFTIISERVVAQKICEWGKPFGLDGVVRLETGFEVIICDFESPKIELLRRGVFDGISDFLGVDLGIEEELSSLYSGTASYDHLKAGASHYDSESRIKIDFSHMITPINRTYISPDTYQRRLIDVSDDVKEQLREDVAEILSNPVNPGFGTNWQEVTDRLPIKLADTLVFINDTFREFLRPESTITADQVAANISAYTVHSLLRFSNITYRDDLAKQRDDAIKAFVVEYASGYVKTEVDALIQASIAEIARLVAVELFHLQDLALDILRKHYNNDVDTNGPEFVERIRSYSDRFSIFLDFLNWPSFYRCKEACRWNEICYIPPWGPSPMGWPAPEGTEHTRRIGYDDPYCVGVKEIAKQKDKKRRRPGHGGPPGTHPKGIAYDMMDFEHLPHNSALHRLKDEPE